MALHCTIWVVIDFEHPISPNHCWLWRVEDKILDFVLHENCAFLQQCFSSFWTLLSMFDNSRLRRWLILSRGCLIVVYNLCWKIFALVGDFGMSWVGWLLGWCMNNGYSYSGNGYGVYWLLVSKIYAMEAISILIKKMIFRVKILTFSFGCSQTLNSEYWRINSMSLEVS